MVIFDSVFQPLNNFYKAAADDPRISATHISVYMALLHQWNVNGGINPVIIERNTLMKAAKINSRYTYSKCMHCLHEYGYIKYYPSFNPFVGSTVYLNNFK